MKQLLPSMKGKHVTGYGSRLRPVRDWMVLLVLFSVFLLASLVWNLWLFSQTTKGYKIGSVTPTPAVQIELEQVKTLFAKRAAEQTKYIQEYRFVDPSL